MTNAPDPTFLEHRRDFRSFVLERAEPWHRDALGRLYDEWARLNCDHFDAALQVPYITFGSPTHPRALGQCCSLSSFGGRLEIRIRPTLLTGEHPHVRCGNDYATGREIFVRDVLLHEMVHQWQFEIAGEAESSYHGHGPVFRDKVNEIGATLGLPRVRSKHARKGEADFPKCQH